MAQIKGIDKNSKTPNHFFKKCTDVLIQNCDGIKLRKYFEDLIIE